MKAIKKWLCQITHWIGRFGWAPHIDTARTSVAICADIMNRKQKRCLFRRLHKQGLISEPTWTGFQSFTREIT